MPKELTHWEITLLQINNPCEHTGFESAVCEICGYPDPRRVIAKLRKDRAELLLELNTAHNRVEDAMERWKKAKARYPNGAEGCCCLFDKDEKQINWCSVHAELRDERDALKADNERLREALRYIAFAIPGPTMKTHAEAAQQALQGGGNESL